MKTIKKLFNKAQTKFNKIQQWWMNKDTQYKLIFHSGIHAFLTFIFLLSMALSIPVLQLIMTSMVIASASIIVVLSAKLQENIEEELDNQILKQKLEKAKDLIAKKQESLKTSYDKDTQEALQSLFETDKSNVDEIKKIMTSELSYAPHQEFNKLFNKSNG